MSQIIQLKRVHFHTNPSVVKIFLKNGKLRNAFLTYQDFEYRCSSEKKTLHMYYQLTDQFRSLKMQIIDVIKRQRLLTVSVTKLKQIISIN
jgi:hypothetical protein